ncbi:MAG: exodeoxyribonuclease VII small subunit [Candidatus Cloacimonetes bacterium]|nr:exodeoxyribonuclease VII small subunit [Candidatus Cloacimonadota bacterium]MBL7108050.1 exodeoxyribonuclease VII small subunit [Candidatus Cloacimonadota bacterium]
MSEIKFEKALNRLQEIVDLMESENLDIEKSLEYYEEGVKLVKNCSDKLRKIENKISLLSEESNQPSEK